jgi:hypothetical protein
MRPHYAGGDDGVKKRGSGGPAQRYRVDVLAMSRAVEQANATGRHLGSPPAVGLVECLNQAHALAGAVARATSPSRAPALTTPPPTSDAESGPGVAA